MYRNLVAENFGYSCTLSDLEDVVIATTEDNHATATLKVIVWSTILTAFIFVKMMMVWL